jgi:ACR3 family arsenite transporter
MPAVEKKQISLFEKYLTLWVALCIVVGTLIGRFVPAIPEFLSTLEYARVSIPVAVLIWLMIYPMMLKVDFSSLKGISQKPKGIVVTTVVNWVIKPISMYLIASLFFLLIFRFYGKPCGLRSSFPK